MAFFVSRQSQYYSKQNVVEIETNGLDYAGSDMLVPRYNGEGQEYTDPREAVEVAIAICREWRKSGTKCSLSMGSTGGMGMETERITFSDARKEAAILWDKMPKCTGCGEPMGKETWYADDWSGQEYCSEYCAQREADYQEEQNYLAEQEEQEEQEA